jgi:5-methylcytosine-specific restriction protein A
VARNPPWTDDELLVVLDLYLEHRRVLEENDPRVIAASELLNRLPLHPRAGSPGFRTPDAVVLRMANYRAYDPSTSARGMTNAGRRAEQIWARYADGHATVRQLVASILLLADDPASGPAGSAVSPEPDEGEIREGRLIYRVHRGRERNPALRTRKLRQVMRAGLEPVCEVCGLSPHRVFGSGFGTVLECHHLRPLLLGQRATRLSDIALVCATCHRAIHAKGLLTTVSELRDALNPEFRAAMSPFSAIGPAS